jgi:hypothetical protein
LVEFWHVQAQTWANLSIVPAQHGATTTQTPRRTRGAGGEEEQAGQARCPWPPQTLDAVGTVGHETAGHHPETCLVDRR